MIKIIKQKRNDDCVLCCVAMVAGVSYSEAKKAFAGNPPYSFMRECIALVRLGLFQDHRDISRLYSGRLHIITVPRLNLRGYNHSIVVDSGDKYKVYDPLNGVKDKKFYSEWKDVKGFSTVIQIIDARK